MDAGTILSKLRRGDAPGNAELAWMTQGLASGAVTDAQAGAFAMGVCLRGLTPTGRVALTRAMRDSGRVLEWDLPGPVLDKHSTGGIGDCVSLLLAPALAECGAYVPMIAGRGLGHTGGTIDKLEAVPGVDPELSVERLQEITVALGCAIAAASPELAPADRRLYAVRDVTGTVASLDLITASILSKKLAAGIGGLMLDVKTGSGAFMKTAGEARELAQTLVETARGAGCRARALVTDMDQPLIPAAGNALEIAVVMEALADAQAHPNLHRLTCTLGGEALVLGGLAKDAQAGAQRIDGALRSGHAMERLGAMLAALGGPSDFVEHWPDRLAAAPVSRAVTAPEAGHVSAIDGEMLGMAVVALGGGRRRPDDRVKPAVGLARIVPLGARVERGDPLAVVHAADEEAAEGVSGAVRMAFTIGPEIHPEPLIREIVG